MRESVNNTILNQYLRETKFYCYYELKIAKRGRFQFSAIEINQDEGLPALEKEGIVWKLTDEDTRKKPCDGFCAPPLPTYLVIKFTNKFYFIRYKNIIKLKEMMVKGINEAEAELVAEKILTVS